MEDHEDFQEDQDDFRSFIERRRAEDSRARQQRFVAILIGCLTLACVALALSNMILAARLATLRSATPAAVVATGGPTAATPTAGPTAPPANPPAGAARETAAPDLTSLPERVPAERAAREQAARERPAAPPASSEAVAASPVSEPRRTIPRPTGVIHSRPSPASPPVRGETGDSAELVANWMIERYGRAEAAERAATAAGFYGPNDPNGAHWRAVLAHIQGGR